MKTLYLECNMGAAGDMLMGALLELIPDRESFLEKLNQYMDSTYPEIEFEDITIDRLENEPYTDNKQFVCEQLKEVKKQLEAEGVNWETIVQQIHSQIE